MIKSLVYSNGKVTIVFDNGDVVMEPCAKEIVIQVLGNNELTQEEILLLVSPRHQEYLEQKIEAKEIVATIISDPRFYEKEGYLYRQGIPLTIPKTFAKDIVQAINNGDTELVDKLDKVWQWASLIKVPAARESLYDYLVKNKIPIAKHGFFILARKAWFRGTEPALTQYVSDTYVKRKGQKKGTNVPVYRDVNGYNLKEGEDVGILADLYHDSDTYFESNHANKDGTKMKYVIGQEASLPWDECDTSDATCSQGLHVAHLTYKDFSSYGDMFLLCAINPKDVVRCPYEKESKMRVRALTPILAMDNNKFENFTITPEIEAMVDEMFENDVKELEQLVKNGDFEEYKLHELFEGSLPEMAKLVSQGFVTDKKLITVNAG
jgi:hypothetical protein